MSSIKAPKATVRYPRSFPYRALQPYRDAAKDILAPLAGYYPDKAHQLIESQGYALDR